MKAEWLRAAFEDGFRCDTGVDTLEGVPVGIVRVTLGAMSTMEDVETLIGCLDRNFVERKKLLKPSSTYIPRYVTTEKKDSLMESRESSADAEKFAIRVDTRTEREKRMIARTKFEMTNPCPRLRLIWGGYLGSGSS
jgi:molybdenum cofactor sulfurtransferase